MMIFELLDDSFNQRFELKIAGTEIRNRNFVVE
jgi:hypothetical protein